MRSPREWVTQRKDLGTEPSDSSVYRLGKRNQEETEMGDGEAEGQAGDGGTAWKPNEKL